MFLKAKMLGFKQASWFQVSFVSGIWSFPFFRAWLCVNFFFFKLYSVLHFSVCVVEERIVLAQSIMEMELEIVTGILISFAHVLPCSQSS